jgi:hypothetical protein
MTPQLLKEYLEVVLWPLVILILIWNATRAARERTYRG